MKKISLYFSLLIVLCCVGCSDDFDEYIGFEFNFNDSFSYTIKSLEKNGCTLEITSGINSVEGNMDVLEAGFIVSSNGKNDTVPCKMEDNMIKGTVKMPYENNRLSSYIKTPEGFYRTYYTTVSVDKKNFLPQITGTKFYMNTVGKLGVEATYTVPLNAASPTSAYIVYKNLKADATISNGKVYADIDLTKLEGLTDSDNMYVYLENIVGTVSSPTGYYAKTNTYADINPDDGPQSDCIRMGGVDWAKGNLQYVNGTWKIAERQDATVHKFSTSTYYYEAKINSNIEHFYYGDTRAIYLSYPNPITDPFPNNFDIQGNKEYDVVAAHLDNWVLPNTTQLRKLTTVSAQLGYTMVDGKQVIGMLFYNTGSKLIIRSNEMVEFKSSDLDKLGLFLPILGFRYYENSIVNFSKKDPENGLRYMSSTMSGGWAEILKWNNNASSSWYVGYPEVRQTSGHEEYMYTVRPVKK